MIEVVLNDRLVRAPAARMNTPVSPRVALVYPRDIPPRTAQRNLVPVVSPNPPSRLQGKKIRVKCNEDDTVGGTPPCLLLRTASLRLLAAHATHQLTCALAHPHGRLFNPQCKGV